MRCEKCWNENIASANYCRFCGAPFTEEAQKKAYDKTVFGVLDRIENLKSWMDLSKFTGNRIVRIVFLLILAALVVFNISRNGSHLAIQKSEEYTVTYNQAANEYYVLTEQDEIGLNTYLPKETDAVTVSCFVDGVERYSVENEPDAEIRLAKIDDGYYVLRADYTDGKSEALTFFVCEGDEA